MTDKAREELNIRMDAYYYGFDLTGAPEIDLILSAVACAGKSFHHTDQWNDQSDPWPAHTGNSPAEWIQNAAIIAAQGNKEAAEEIARLQAENERLTNNRDMWKAQCERQSKDLLEFYAGVDPKWSLMDQSILIDHLRENTNFCADKFDKMVQFAVDAAIRMERKP